MVTAIVLLLAYPFVVRLLKHENTVNSGDQVDVAAFLNRSLQMYQAGQYTASIAAAREALKLDPHSELAYNNIAASYGAMQMWDDAIQNAREALRIRPDFALAQNNLSWFLKAKEGAPASSASPKSAADHLNVSLEHYNQGRFQECIDEAREALKLKPDYAEAYNNIAAGSIRLGKWDQAIQSAQEALRLKPDFVLARNNLNLALKSKAGPAQ
ncbi:MAG TPA: tetratricopeptide repeat protein [Bryobacteraceae bacterium]|nr:tetratricopeptide repeat protein [Bryobacteraceae bacterium]